VLVDKMIVSSNVSLLYLVGKVSWSCSRWTNGLMS
jgi:hypothetical protein